MTCVFAPGGLRDRRARRAAADGEALEEPAGHVRDAEADDLAVRVDAVAVPGGERPGQDARVGERDERDARSPRRAAARGRRGARTGTTGAGSPRGTGPTTRHRLREPEDRHGDRREHDRDEDPGHARRDAPEPEDDERGTPPPIASAWGTVSPGEHLRQNSTKPAMTPSASTEKPKSFGSWLDDDRERDAVHVADADRLREQVGDEPDRASPAAMQRSAGDDREHARERDRPFRVAAGQREDRRRR